MPDHFLSIVLASNNKGKLAELSELLQPYRVRLHLLADFTTDSAEETGATFRENALIKARFAANVARIAAIADDSGLEVDALGGAPGVYSARYAGAGATDAANNEKLIHALRDIPDNGRTGRFRCVLAFVRTADDVRPLFAEGVWNGRLLRAPRGRHGFGYDPLFVPMGGNLSSAELSRVEKNRVSHRAQALRALLDILRKHGELKTP